MRRFIPAVLALALSLPGVALAAGDAARPDQRSWSWDGPFGTYDREQLRRGLDIYMLQCGNCHGLKYIRFRDLVLVGLGEDEAKAIAGRHQVAGEPDEWGDPTVRPAELSDAFPDPYRNDAEARALNNGALPPDLSLMAKARADGPNYIAALLSDPGYNEGVPDESGLHGNPFFPGGRIAMAPPLWDDMLGDGATVERQAEDIAAFLAWTAEPKLEDRKSLGLKVVLFLLALTGLVYVCKRKIWAGIEH